MKLARLVPGVAVLTLAGFLYAGSALSFEAGEADYTIVINKVSVQKTKADGASWDVMDGKPDLSVSVRNYSVKDSKAFETKEMTDVFEAKYNVPTDVKFRAGQTLEFKVVDNDVAADDEIGLTRHEMTEKLIKTGTLRLENFGRVIVLEIEVKKL